MDLKRYQKTRYENIYRNIKNGNYIVQISNPKTTISTFNDGKKIFDIEIAKKLRNNDKIKQLKSNNIAHIDIFSSLWDKYIYSCENYEKMSYNTLKKKRIFYKTYFCDFYNKRITKIKKQDILIFMENLKTTNKEKNEILKVLKAFFNWCIKEEYILVLPTLGIKNYKIEKDKLKYWLPEDSNRFIETLNYYIQNGSDYEKISARTIKMLAIIGLVLGDRIGETRALRFSDIDYKNKTIFIAHSINYNTRDNNPIKETKTKESIRILPITEKFINELDSYKEFLKNNLCINIKKDTFIFINPTTNKPYSDASLRKHWYYFIEKAGVPKIWMYHLRHTFATNLLSDGNDIFTVSKILGHTNISTTTKHYADIIDKKRREVINSTDTFY